MTTDLEGDQEETIQLDCINLKRVTNFKHIGSMMQSSGDLNKEIATEESPLNLNARYTKQ